ncbi:hypothetical protein [Candidatus Solincola tengchongensis]|uniref:hypothetical protein n=1 Tax=Candidatus Solincola tengchongensis TaxID=2900693 RepID=UPI00257C53DF|nr:hypothetical protein [Candidatus Solincola tengchongensis]
MEERYRTPARRERDPLAEEMGKYSICYALSEHSSAEGRDRRGRDHSGMEVQGIKEAIFGESLREGDTVEAEGMLSAYAVLYQPRAYYPAYVMGEMRAALRRGEPPPPTSPHYLPVCRLPRLPDGLGIGFLYPSGRRDFDRPDFPARLRDVLTRDFPRLPVLLPEGFDGGWGLVRLRARVLRLEKDTMSRLAGMGEDAYAAYAARGLVHFLEPLEVERVETLPMRGSLFVEMSLPQACSWERACGALDMVLREAVEEVFPPCERGEREEGTCYLPRGGHHLFRFRTRLFAMVYRPAIAVYRAPRFLGLFLPEDLGQEDEGVHELFRCLAEYVGDRMSEETGAGAACRVEVAYDNRLPWVRRRGALSGPDFRRLESRFPFLAPTLKWLRG